MNSHSRYPKRDGTLEHYEPWLNALFLHRRMHDRRAGHRAALVVAFDRAIVY